MQVFFEQNLVFLAVPKTGTTALSMGLRRHADIIFAKRRKHMTAMRYRNKVAPFLQDAFQITPQVFAVMRDPVDQIRSWYRYRSTLLVSNPRSSSGLSFDDYVQDVIKDDPPAYAGIGSQYRFLTSARGKLLVDHLFAYEAQPVLMAFIQAHFGTQVEFKQKNVSPKRPAPISPEVEAQLRKARPEEFALYHQLMKANGHLENAMQ